MNARLDAVVRAISKIDEQDFQKYRGTFKNEISSALVDAVFSMRAQYHAKNPRLGVFGRGNTFRKTHPAVVDDLHALIALGEQPLREIMGNSVSAQKRKSELVIRAAERLVRLEPPIATSAAASPAELNGEERDERACQIKRAYVGIHGLGKVTANYFLMHLGYPRIKPDVWIERFIVAALRKSGFESRPNLAEQTHFIEAAFGRDSRGAESLQAFDHAIWLQKTPG